MIVKRFSASCVVLIGLLICACTHAQEAARSRFHESVLTHFPESDFVVGQGSGETRELAEERAVVDAASAIRSELTANLRAFVSERQVDGQSNTKQEVSEEIVRRVHSDAVALIRPRRDMTERVGREYLAVAAVGRAELGRKYQAELQPVIESVDALWRRIAEAPSAATFQAAMCRMEELERIVDGKAAEYYAATRTSILSPEQQQRRRTALQVVENHRRQAVARFTPSTTPEGAPQLAPALLGGLRTLGIAARMASDRSCADGGLLVDTAAVHDCKDGPLGGIACELQYRAVVWSCAEGRVVSEELSPIGRGQHPSSPAHALTAASRNLQIESFAAETARVLAHSLAMRCPQ